MLARLRPLVPLLMLVACGEQTISTQKQPTFTGSTQVTVTARIDNLPVSVFYDSEGYLRDNPGDTGKKSAYLRRGAPTTFSIPRDASCNRELVNVDPNDRPFGIEIKFGFPDGTLPELARQVPENSLATVAIDGVDLGPLPLVNHIDCTPEVVKVNPDCMQKFKPLLTSSFPALLIPQILYSCTP